MTVREWERRINHAWETGDTYTYRKLVGKRGLRNDRDAIWLKMARDRLKRAHRTWGEWLSEEVL